MTARPLSISIISWIAIAVCIVGLVSIPFELEIFVFAGNPHLTLPLKIALLSLSALAQVIGAIGMLKARNWARYLFLASILPYAVAEYVGKASFAGPFVIAAVQSLFLFSSKANVYFHGPIKAPLRCS